MEIISEMFLKHSSRWWSSFLCLQKTFVLVLTSPRIEFSLYFTTAMSFVHRGHQIKSKEKKAVASKKGIIIHIYLKYQRLIAHLIIVLY